MKRTAADFSKHEVIVTNNEFINSWWLKLPNSSYFNVKFINVDGVLSVTGDLGNWIFCREFWPDKNNDVSDHYWCEKLMTYSIQNPYEFDSEGTRKEIEYQIEKGLEESGYECNELVTAKLFMDSYLGHVDDEVSYLEYTGNNFPNFADYDFAPYVRKINSRLLIVFDAFDEICSRM